MTVIRFMPALPPVDCREALRYMGCADTDDPRLLALTARAAAEIQALAAPAACYMQAPLRFMPDNGMDFDFMQVRSTALNKHLQGCKTVYWFAATLGAACDRAIYRAGITEPSYALALDACGSAAIEGLCDAVNHRLFEVAGEQGLVLRSRFSAGYGDFPLSCQPQILTALDAARKIGLTCTESLMLTPVKSVTAVIGGYSSTAYAEEQ